QLDVPRERVDPGDATRLPPHPAGKRSPDKPGLERAGATGLRKPGCKSWVARVATDEAKQLSKRQRTHQVGAGQTGAVAQGDLSGINPDGIDQKAPLDIQTLRP